MLYPYRIHPPSFVQRIYIAFTDFHILLFISHLSCIFSDLVLGVHYWVGTITAYKVSECEMSTLPHSNLRKAISLLLESADSQELLISFSDLPNTHLGTKCSPKVTARSTRQQDCSARPCYSVDGIQTPWALREHALEPCNVHRTALWKEAFH